MQNPQHTPSLFNRSLNWLANFTYRQIPSLINSYQKKQQSPKQLCFEDYILSPTLAQEAGLMYVRQLRKNYIKEKQVIQKQLSSFKSSSQDIVQKPHELLCPICLQLFNGPVTTVCSHTFCRMCIDEAILFSPTCPVCRNEIRAHQLRVSKSIENLIRTLLYKLQIEEVEKYVKKQLQYQEWMEKRTLKKHELQVGQLIDARDTQHIWCKASILAILPANASSPQQYESILVHYEGWAPIFDEVISLQSLRLASHRFYMSRPEIPHYNLREDNQQHLRSQVIRGQPVELPVQVMNQQYSQPQSIPSQPSHLLELNEDYVSQDSQSWYEQSIRDADESESSLQSSQDQNLGDQRIVREIAGRFDGFVDSFEVVRRRRVLEAEGQIAREIQHFRDSRHNSSYSSGLQQCCDLNIQESNCDGSEVRGEIQGQDVLLQYNEGNQFSTISLGDSGEGVGEEDEHLSSNDHEVNVYDLYFGSQIDGLDVEEIPRLENSQEEEWIENEIDWNWGRPQFVRENPEKMDQGLQCLLKREQLQLQVQQVPDLYQQLYNGKKTDVQLQEQSWEEEVEDVSG